MSKLFQSHNGAHPRPASSAFRYVYTLNISLRLHAVLESALFWAALSWNQCSSGQRSVGISVLLGSAQLESAIFWAALSETLRSLRET